jgi:NitT/TauT family transport system substrate-binding protein
MNKRFLLKATAALAAAASFGLAHAQSTAIKFQLDWRFEGPSAFFLLPVAKGYFKDAKLDVTVDSGNGSGGAVTRVASGTYDLGFADLAALMEFHANNPDAPNKPVAIMMVYNNTPASVMALKKSGIKTPADLAGKKLGAPVFDAGRRAPAWFHAGVGPWRSRPRCQCCWLSGRWGRRGDRRQTQERPVFCQPGRRGS